MQLLASVNAGFQACPNGWVELYIRGSSTRATWYASFEGSGANSTGANITLDAYGSAEVYVNQLVDVVVKQSDGTLYRQYTDGYSSPNIEARSNSFTGTDYNTAVVAPGNPTTLQAVLDKWIVSAGASAVDWQVHYRGSPHTLSELAGVIGGLVINVQSAAYGAVGDGTTDDTSAILNALAAALLALDGNAGVTVFFPKGNYRITSVITWDYRVNIVMVPGSTLAIDGATSGTLKFTSANSTSYETIFLGVGFKALQANTGVALSLEADQKLTLISCQFGGSALDTGTQINVAGSISKLTLQRCRFRLNGSTQSAISCTSGYVAALKMIDCEVVTPATYTGTAVNTSGFGTSYSFNVHRTLFDGTTNSSAGAFMFMRPGAFALNMTLTDSRMLGAGSYGLFFEGTSATVSGNYFSGLTTALEFDGVAAAMAYGNRFASVTNRYAVASSLSAGSYLEMDHFESKSNPGTGYTLGAFTEFTYVESNAGSPTVTLLAGLYYGQPRKVLYHNNASGGSWTVTYSGTMVPLSALSSTTSVANNAYVMDSFIWTPIGWSKWQST